MPHPFELNLNLRTALAKMSGEIIPRILLRARTKKNIGVPPAVIIGDDYEEIFFDVSDRLHKEGQVRTTMSKPILPTNDNNLFVTSKISLPFLNPDKFFAATQSGAILDPASIELAELFIEAEITGSTDTIDIGRWRVSDIPAESKDRTILSGRDNLYNLAKESVLFEYFGKINKEIQDTYVNGQGNLINKFVTIITTHGEAKYYDGYVFFREDAEVTPAITNDKASQLELTNLTIKNRALLGKYTIEFRDANSYFVTHPDGTTLEGVLTSIFDSDSITIIPEFWGGFDLATLVPGDQLSGIDVKIEFNVFNSQSGNPITLVKNIIEKAFKDNWGEIPTFPLDLPVDWVAFDRAERIFKAYEVFVSETNENSKFERVPGNKPLNCLQFCQKILDHVGCSLIHNLSGEISLKLPYLFDDPIFEVTDDTAIMEHSVIGNVRRVNNVTFQYGYNAYNDNYGAALPVVDIRADDTREKEPETFSFPYYKAGTSDNKMRWLRDLLMNRIITSPVQMSLKLLPNFGIAAMPGDRVKVVTSTQPIMSIYVEYYNVSRIVASDGTGLVKAFKIQSPEGKEPVFCTFLLCTDAIC